MAVNNNNNNNKLIIIGDDREHLFLFQRISVAIQHFNAVLLHAGFPSEDRPN